MALFALTGRADIHRRHRARRERKIHACQCARQELRAVRKKRVAIIAVDPSSPFTGGAILGDAVSECRIWQAPASLSAAWHRAAVVGLASAVSDAIHVLDAAGFDIILVETVGAGQGEVDIAKHAVYHTRSRSPGFGDDIQAIKAGILEIADILVVNKADRDGANATAAALEMNLGLNPEKTAWRPPILKTTALTGEGVSQLVDSIAAHEAYLNDNDLRAKKEAALL